MIVASRFGWDAVSRSPMTLYDLLLAAQLMSEERVGSSHRAQQRALVSEDAEALSKLDRYKG